MKKLVLFSIIVLSSLISMADISEPKNVTINKLESKLNLEPMPAPKLFINISSIIKPEEEIDKKIPVSSPIDISSLIKPEDDIDEDYPWED